MTLVWFSRGVPIAEAGGRRAARSCEGWGEFVEFLKKKSWVKKVLA